MASDNHGSAFLDRHAGIKFSTVVNRNSFSTAIMLGINRPYSGYARVQPEAGQYYVWDGERIDNREYGMSWNPVNVRGMSVCFGSAQSGKDAGLIIPTLLTFGGNVVVNDPKGEDSYICLQRRREIPGRKVALADPYNEVNHAYGSKAGVTETVTRYNPLAHLNPASLDFAEDVAAIGEALTMKDHGSDSAFFSGAGRDLIDGTIASVVESASRAGQLASMRMVRELLTMDDQAFAVYVAGHCVEFPRSLGARKLASFATVTKTGQSIRQTAKEQTKFLDSERILRYMEPQPGEPTFSMAELATGNLDLFLVLPATQAINQSRWLRVMINQSIRAILSARTPQPLPTLFMLNEAGTSLGHLDEVENAYGLTAGMGVCVWSFYQDISQIERDYPKSWETFIGNSACIQLIAAKDKKTSDYFSAYMGNKTVNTTSRSTSSGSSGHPSTSTTVGEMGRPLKTPDEIRSMPLNEMLAIFPKGGNFHLFKIEYYKDARYNGMYRPDPIRQTAYPDPVPAPPLETFDSENPKPTPLQKGARWVAIGFLVLGCYWALKTIGLALHLYRDWTTTVGNDFFRMFILLVIAGFFYLVSRAKKPSQPRLVIGEKGYLKYV